MVSIPTLTELYNDMVASIEAELSITVPTTGPSYLRAQAAVDAAKLYLLYLAIADVQKNIFADTADPESAGGALERFGRVKLGRGPFPATAAFYKIQLTGTTGAVVPENTRWAADDSSDAPGELFVKDAEYTLDGTNQIIVRALTVGLDARLSVGNTMSLVQPVALVDTVATVLTEETIPQAAETTEEYREKVLEAFRLAAQGGSASDYRVWAGEVQGVDESYPYASASANQVDLYIEATAEDSTDGKGTPTAAILTAVEEAIEDPTTDRPSRKPLTVQQVNYLAVTPLDITIDIASYTDLTAAKQTTILSALTELIDSIRPYVAAIDVAADKNDILDQNRVINAILEAVPGSTFGSVTITVGGVGYSSYTFTNGNIPYLDQVTGVTYS